MTQRIVVVEDTPEILILFEDILTEEGYDVVPFTSPLSALEQIATVGPDLIILDYIFGQEAAGWHMVHALKLNQETAHIPIMLCTAAARLAQELDGYVATGEVTVLPKPFSIDELLTAVLQVLPV